MTSRFDQACDKAISRSLASKDAIQDTSAMLSEKEACKGNVWNIEVKKTRLKWGGEGLDKGKVSGRSIRKICVR